MEKSVPKVGLAYISTLFNIHLQNVDCSLIILLFILCLLYM